MFVSLENLEAHPFIKFNGLRILFVYIHILHIQITKSAFHQHLAQSLAETVRMKEKHLDLAILHAHEADSTTAIVQHP